MSDYRVKDCYDLSLPPGYTDPTEALEDAIMADILPQLEGASQAIKRAPTAVSAVGAFAEAGNPTGITWLI
ncbi:MAG TPA: hypothetical protein VH186_31145 [Chloroflexia bacterium]|nr:hypothetical protein [Chloroflexia bacterium]